MKKIIVALLLCAPSAFANMPAEGGYAFKNNAKGYAGGWNLNVTKQIGNTQLRRTVAYKDTVIIGIRSEKASKLWYQTYGRVVGSNNTQYPLNRLLQQIGWSGVEVTVSTLNNFLEVFREYSPQDLIPDPLRENAQLYEKFQNETYIFYGPVLRLDFGVRGRWLFQDLYEIPYKILMASFPGLEQRGIGRKEITVFDVARYVLGLPEPNNGEPLTLNEIENAYKLTRLKWEILAQHFNQKPHAQNNCKNLIKFIDESYDTLKAIGQHDVSPLVVPDTYISDPNVLIQLGLQDKRNSGQPITAYDIIGVKEDASLKDIHNQYKKLALKWHPDKHAPDDKTAAENIFKVLAWANDAINRIREEDSNK